MRQRAVNAQAMRAMVDSHQPRQPRRDGSNDALVSHRSPVANAVGRQAITRALHSILGLRPAC